MLGMRVATLGKDGCWKDGVGCSMEPDEVPEAEDDAHPGAGDAVCEAESGLVWAPELPAPIIGVLGPSPCGLLGNRVGGEREEEDCGLRLEGWCVLWLGESSRLPEEWPLRLDISGGLVISLRFSWWCDGGLLTMLGRPMVAVTPAWAAIALAICMWLDKPRAGCPRDREVVAILFGIMWASDVGNEDPDKAEEGRSGTWFNWCISIMASQFTQQYHGLTIPSIY